MITSRSIVNFARLGMIFVGLLWSGVIVSRATPYYVATNGAGGDFLSWGAAATNIQDAISKATNAGDIVWVSNGVYQTGGVTNWPATVALTNRVAITNAITVRSANNNPANTIIKGAWDPAANGQGSSAVRCVYMVADSSLIGFMLTNGATFADGYLEKMGAGVYGSGTISNCIVTGGSAAYLGGGGQGGKWFNCTIIGNRSGYGAMYSATMSNCTISGNTANYGGGIYDGTYYNCTIVSNKADINGGGVSASGGITLRLYNCLIIGNEAPNGGGVGSFYALANTYAYNCTIVGNKATTSGGGVYSDSSITNRVLLQNSILYFNSAPAGSNWFGLCYFTNSCTTTAAVDWVTGNITSDPLFVTNGSGYGTNHVVGNYRLVANSPCINAGTNGSWMTNSYDLDGRTRIRYGTVDIGAYERINEGTIYKLW